jgi:hypothetical protein
MAEVHNRLLVQLSHENAELERLHIRSERMELMARASETLARSRELVIKANEALARKPFDPADAHLKPKTARAAETQVSDHI